MMISHFFQRLVKICEFFIIETNLCFIQGGSKDNSQTCNYYISVIALDFVFEFGTLFTYLITQTCQLFDRGNKL